MRRTLVSTLALGAFVALAFGSDPSDEGGVKGGMDLTPANQACVDDLAVLEEGETLISYYDETITLDCSELVLLTDRKLVRHAGGSTQSVALVDIEESEVRDEGLIGTTIDVRTADGQRMSITIAPMNGAEVFVDDLEFQLGRLKGE